MRLSSILSIAIIFCTFLFANQPALAADPIVLGSEALNGHYIGTKCDYYEDKGKVLTIGDIAGDKVQSQFKPGAADVMQLGFSQSHNWFRFTLNNTGNEARDFYMELDYPLVEEIDFYIPDGKGSFTVKKSSLFIGASRREVAHFNHIFMASCKPGIHTFYIMIYTKGGALTVPIRLWAPAVLLNNINKSYIIYLVFYTILIFIFLYNLFIFLSILDRNYLFYIINILCYGVLYLALDGLGYAFVWDWLPTGVWPIFLSFVIAFSHISALQFTRQYLQMNEHTPRLDRLLLAYIVLDVLMAMSSLVTDLSVLLLSLLGLVEMITAVFAIGPVYLKKRSRPALFYFSAYLFIIVGWILNTFGSFGGGGLDLLARYGTQIGFICMAILFSLGLADKINTMKNELADLNKNLERKVEERTAELNAAMEELEAMNQNLKSTMEELEATNEQLIATRDALWGEMQLAKKIQTVLLPAEPRIPGFEIAAHMEPADEVGGDYYDVINVGGRDWIVIGDVSGHGVPAGLVMMMVQTAIQTALAQNPGLMPSALLEIINTIITSNIKRLGENKYMTITVFAFVEGGTFHFSGLHQDILVYRKARRSVESIPTNGMWIGVVDDLKGMMTDDSLVLDPGDAVLLYTDGVTEARDQGDTMYSEEKLAHLFRECAGQTSLEIKNQLLASLTGYDRKDDVTLLVLKRNG